MKSKLPKEWESLKIEEVIDTQVDNRGRNPAIYLEHSEYPVIDNYLIKNERYPNMTNVNRYIDEDTFNNFLRGYVNKDDVIITLVGNGIANVSMVPHSKAVIIQNTLGLRCNDSMYNKFLYYSLLYNQESIKNFDRGSSQPSIRKTDLFKYRILKPNLSEQKAIADTLSALDDKIDLNNIISLNLEQQAQAIFKHWFIDFEFPDENGNPYISSGGEMIESELGMIPKGWKTIELSEIADLTMGLSPKSDSYNFEKLGIPLLNGASDFEGGIIKETKHTTQPTRICNKDDLVFCIRATIGNLTFADKEYCLGRGVASITPKRGEFKGILYYNLLKSMEMLIANAAGSVILGLSKPDINNIKIMLPDDKTLNYFSGFTDNIFKIKQNKEIETKSLSQIRDTLLPKLMSGEIRIPLD